MKKYIGTLNVTAEPMTYGDAFKNGVIPPSSYIKEYNESPGYKVVYDDGGSDWLSKDCFEKAYKVADTPVERMHLEYDELRDKNSKLYGFIKNEKFETLSSEIKALLYAQDVAMADYMNLLATRTTLMESGGRGMGSFSFGIAITLLERGFVLRREGWNGKGLVVFKQVPAHITSEIIPKMQSLPQAAKEFIMRSKEVIDYTSQCLIYNDTTGRADSWVPSISDVFARDWELVIA